MTEAGHNNDLSFESVLFGQEDGNARRQDQSMSPVSEDKECSTYHSTTSEGERTRSTSGGSQTYKSLETGTKVDVGKTSPKSNARSRQHNQQQQKRRTRASSGAVSSKNSQGLLPSPTLPTRETRARSWSDRMGSTYEILDVNAVFVANVEPGTDFQALIRHFQAHGGSVAAYHFRAGQRFGFIQFTTPEDCQAAVDHVNDSLFQTSHLHVEKCPRFTPGRDPRMPTEPVSGKSSSCTLVLKNLPFHLKQEKLQDIFGKMDIRPQFVNYHLDRTGAFRGMAFVKFRRMEDAQRAHTFINGMEISSRKIRVEFKQRKNKEKASLEYDLKDPEVARFHNQLVNFRDSMLADMCFPPTLTSAQRKTVHTIAESLGLAHVSLGEGEGRFVTVSRKEGASVAPSLAPTAPAVQTRSSTTVSANSSAGTSPIDVRVSKPPTHQGGTPGNGHNHHKAPSHGPAGLSSGARSRTRSDTSHLSGSPGGRSRTRSDTGHLFGRSPGSSYGKSPSSIVSRLSQYELYTPPTQPTGPDSSSRGFNNGAHRPKYIRQQMELLSRTLGADDDTPNGMSLMQMSLMSRLGHDPSNDSDYNTI